MTDSKLVMLVGLPDSGKGTYAKGLSVSDNAVILSSDDLRAELYGNENHQDDNGALFHELYRRTMQLLKGGSNVIIDATNINAKRRMTVTKEFRHFDLECHYLDTPIQICWERDQQRKRQVGYHVIDRMYKTLQVPSYKEGWNTVKYIHNYESHRKVSLAHYLESLIIEDRSYNEMFLEELADFEIFLNILELPHDSTYHSLSVSRHTYHVWNYVLENYNQPDKLIMLWAALLHDIGKAYCKSFKDVSRYASFIGHENVSAQLACNFLSWIGYDDDFVSKVVELVQLHMRLLQLDDNTEAINKLRLFVGDGVFHKLTVLRSADVNAH